MATALPPCQLRFETIRIGGVERTYGLADGGPPGSPLLVVLHGRGIDASMLARWTGLASRGPAAGFATVFPEGLARAWDDTGGGRIDGADDAAFISTVIERLSAGVAAVVLVGLSNGASFAEHLARHGLVEVRGLALVAGTARVASRERAPKPAQPCAVMCVVGTSDPVLPYSGGPAGGLIGWLLRRRARSIFTSTAGREAVAAEAILGDWAEVNGAVDPPTTETVPVGGGDLPVEKVSWSSDGPPVQLYRVIGGGHGWPGGPQYAPRLLIGRVAKTFDATLAVLDFARAVVQSQGDLHPGKGVQTGPEREIPATGRALTYDQSDGTFCTLEDR